MILVLCGRAGSGKDTLAKILCTQSGFVKYTLSEPLKDSVASITGWERNKLEGITQEDREWREQPDPIWSSILKKPFTPRQFLTWLGTDIVRSHAPTMWIDSLQSRLIQHVQNTFSREDNSFQPVVITDCRFQNEIQFFRQLNQNKDLPVFNKIKFVEIIRGTMFEDSPMVSMTNTQTFPDTLPYIKFYPQWFQHYRIFGEMPQGTNPNSIPHISEYDWGFVNGKTFQADFVLYNTVSPTIGQTSYDPLKDTNLLKQTTKMLEHFQ